MAVALYLAGLRSEVLLLTAAALVLGVCTYGLQYYLYTWFVPVPLRDLPLEDRLKMLAKSITAASEAASSIESELELRQRTVEELARRGADWEELVKLNRKQVEAVSGLVEGAMARQERRAFVLNTLVSFVLGVLTTIATEIILRWSGILGR